MIEIMDKEKCCGCHACFNICPKHAIEMKEDEEGFKYPVINEEKCINCGLCKKTCPLLNNNSNNKSINKCYVAYNKDSKAKENSSSGAIFELLAKKVLKENGIVIGAAFDDENKLSHIAINDEIGLEKLKGSKYLQSDLKDIFLYVKENIEKKKILFVGVPCQVAGLKSYLKKDYDNLICVDLVCHGVPSPKLFDKYKNELECKYDDKILNYNFRDKTTGWDTYSNTATFGNNKFTELNCNNNYMKLFLSDIALRESCYSCNFKLGNKYSDITLGDFWGVKNYYPEMYNKEGVSAVIINTNKGIKVFDDISNDLVYKECKIEEIVNGNPSLKNSAKRPNKRNEFFSEIDALSIEEMADKYKKKNSCVRRILEKCKRFVKRAMSKFTKNRK